MRTLAKHSKEARKLVSRFRHPSVRQTGIVAFLSPDKSNTIFVEVVNDIVAEIVLERFLFKPTTYSMRVGKANDSERVIDIISEYKSATWQPLRQTLIDIATGK